MIFQSFYKLKNILYWASVSLICVPISQHIDKLGYNLSSMTNFHQKVFSNNPSSCIKMLQALKTTTLLQFLVYTIICKHPLVKF